MRHTVDSDTRAAIIRTPLAISDDALAVAHARPKEVVRHIRTKYANLIQKPARIISQGVGKLNECSGMSALATERTMMRRGSEALLARQIKAGITWVPAK